MSTGLMECIVGSQSLGRRPDSQVPATRPLSRWTLNSRTESPSGHTAGASALSTLSRLLVFASSLIVSSYYSFLISRAPTSSLSPLTPLSSSIGLPSLFYFRLETHLLEFCLRIFIHSLFSLSSTDWFFSFLSDPIYTDLMEFCYSGVLAIHITVTCGWLSWPAGF